MWATGLSNKMKKKKTYNIISIAEGPRSREQKGNKNKGETKRFFSILWKEERGICSNKKLIPEFHLAFSLL